MHACVDSWCTCNCLQGGMTMEVVGTCAFGISIDSLSATAQQLAPGSDLKALAGPPPPAPNTGPGASPAAAGGPAAAAQSLGRPSTAQEEANAQALGQRVVKAIGVILDSSRPENSSLWVPLYLAFPAMGPLISWLAKVR